MGVWGPQKAVVGMGPSGYPEGGAMEVGALRRLRGNGAMPWEWGQAGVGME